MGVATLALLALAGGAWGCAVVSLLNKQEREMWVFCAVAAAAMFLGEWLWRAGG